MAASEAGHLALAKLLVDNGGDPKYVNSVMIETYEYFE